MPERLKRLAARPTSYKGIRMRSRLEAEYAQSIDSHPAEICRRTWVYEPLCYADDTGQYLPDFRVTWAATGGVTFVEVKPLLTPDRVPEIAARMEIILSSEPKVGLEIVAPGPDEYRFSRPIRSYFRKGDWYFDDGVVDGPEPCWSGGRW